MSRKYNVTISPKAFSHKPKTGSEFESIQNSFITSGMTCDQLVKYVAPPYSYTIAPSVFKNGKRNKESWLSQQVYMLDFDGTVTIDQVIDRFNEYGITPNFYYSTFGSSETEPRFRVVLLTDFENKDKNDGQRIRTGLLKVFPEADAKCASSERMFFGGNDSVRLNEEPIPFDKLEQMISLFVIDSDFGKTRGIISDQGYLDCQNEQDSAANEQRRRAQEYLERLKDNEFDYAELAKRVKIFKDFIDGVWLRHDELFGIATALRWLKGGEKLFNETMKRYNDLGQTFYSKEKFRIMPYLAKRKLFPKNLRNFSPHPEDWDLGNLIYAVRTQRGLIERIRQPKYITLEEGIRKFEDEANQAIAAEDNKIYLFKVPTGLGKTTFLTSLTGQLMAFPTHKLKDEVAEKITTEKIVIPQLPEFSDPILAKKIKQFYSMGLNDSARNLVAGIAAGSEHPWTSSEDQEIARAYLNKINDVDFHNQTVLTTHQRALQMKVQHDTIIFDEDPILEILNIDQVSISDLNDLNSRLPHQFRIDNALELINSSKPGVVNIFDGWNIPRKVLNTLLLVNPVKTNVAKFIRSSAYIRDSQNSNQISYIIHRKLPEKKKVIIMSATLQTHLYERLYPNRVKVIDLSRIEHVGKIYQHTKYSCSKASLNEKVASEIAEEIGHLPLITFKTKKSLFPTISHDMHWWNQKGYDSLRGSDLAVVGTPHYNDVVYRLIGVAVGMHVNEEQKLSYRKVEYGDFRFKFMTFANPELQKIQLGLIEAELIQAVGRARTLREVCIVELYSNLPLSGAIFENECDTRQKMHSKMSSKA